MLTLIVVSGLAVAYFRMHEGSPKNEGRTNWLWMVFAKCVILIFLTPVTDLIAFSWVATSEQTSLTEP